MVKNSIYLETVLLIIIFLAILPITKVPISSSSKGVIRSITENTKLNSVVNGRIIETKLEKNNQFLKQGDTLIVIQNN
jgi:HlyD family secretion protein